MERSGKQELQEVPEVPEADASASPGAVVVVYLHTDATCLAMKGPWRPQDLASLAIAERVVLVIQDFTHGCCLPLYRFQQLEFRIRKVLLDLRHLARQ